jgi:hypothetical protein
METIAGDRGGTVEVQCTFCGKLFHRYKSLTVDKNGNPRKIVKCNDCKRVPPEKRFWAMADKTSSPNGCWLWTGAIHPEGYGQFPYGFPGQQRAHRISWFLLKGPIPKHLYVLHKPECHNPSCVNPDHLYIGDQFANMQDAKRAGNHYFSKCHGQDVHNALLNEQKVREIRRDYESNNAKTLAEKYGVTVACIRDVAKRRSWRHVK